MKVGVTAAIYQQSGGMQLLLSTSSTSLSLQLTHAELTSAIMVDTVSATTPVCACLDSPATTAQHTMILASDDIVCIHACMCVYVGVCVCMCVC